MTDYIVARHHKCVLNVCTCHSGTLCEIYWCIDTFFLVVSVIALLLYSYSRTASVFRVVLPGKLPVFHHIWGSGLSGGGIKWSAPTCPACRAQAHQHYLSDCDLSVRAGRRHEPLCSFCACLCIWLHSICRSCLHLASFIDTFLFNVFLKTILGQIHDMNHRSSNNDLSPFIFDRKWKHVPAVPQ